MGSCQPLPLCIDLFCGLGGWTEGFLAEGWRVIGFDLVRHAGYPGLLVLQNVETLHGSQFRRAHMIVASPPCGDYSYRAMPWKRAKALPAPDNTLFFAPFRIQQEACEAAERHIPLIVENVRGAQPWVGRARWHHGSYYLWGDVPALMPNLRGFRAGAAAGNSGAASTNSTHTSANALQSKNGTAILTCLADQQHVKQPGLPGKTWFDHGAAHFCSTSPERKAASALLAKIDFGLATYIARVFRP
jgi:hypothetical protein